MSNLRKLHDGVYTNTYTANHGRFGNVIQRKLQYIYAAKEFLHDYMDIKPRAKVLLTLLRQPKDWQLIGVMKTTNTIVVDPRYQLNTNILALAHEMVHYDQIMRGDMTFVYDDVESEDISDILWKGESYGQAEAPTKSMDRYFNLPWEIEAVEKENFLAELTMVHLGIPIDFEVKT